MTLRETQSLFARLLAELVLDLAARGYAITYGETWRPPEMARIYADQGKGIAGSLHCSRLAADLNLFRDGRLLTDPQDYAEAGALWTAKHPLCRWGGAFRNKDAVHFSLTWGGRA